MSNWIENLKVGDKVIVSSVKTESIEEVTGITKTQIKVSKSGFKYRKKGGMQVGGGGSLLKEATEEGIEQLRRHKRKKELCRKLEDTYWSTFSLEHLEIIAKPID